MEIENIVKAAGAEFVGTILLVLVGTAVATAAILGADTAGPADDSLAIALSFGLALTSIAVAIGQVSLRCPRPVGGCLGLARTR